MILKDCAIIEHFGKKSMNKIIEQMIDYHKMWVFNITYVDIIHSVHTHINVQYTHLLTHTQAFINLENHVLNQLQGKVRHKKEFWEI